MSRALIRAAALVALFSLGCQHGPYAPREYRAGTTSYEHTEKIIFADRTLASRVRVVSMRSSVEDDGRLKAYAELENRTAKNLAVQVQTQFRNEAGALTQDVTNWRTMVMAPNSVTLYESTSISDTARDFIIRVKWEKRH